MRSDQKGHGRVTVQLPFTAPHVPFRSSFGSQIRFLIFHARKILYQGSGIPLQTILCVTAFANWGPNLSGVTLGHGDRQDDHALLWLRLSW
jgi:hypothetical protein